jgi:hypothetical protein
MKRRIRIVPASQLLIRITGHVGLRLGGAILSVYETGLA